MMNDELIALKDELRALTDRLERMEKDAPTLGRDASELYLRQIYENLLRERKKDGSAFAFAFTTMVMQSADKGDTGTAHWVQTISKEQDLPTDSDLDARRERLAHLSADPLIPRVFRELLRPRFHDKPRQATAAELASALHTTPEHIEAVLRPLLEDQTLRRGLTPDNVAFYEWDGNTARVMCLLLQD